MPITDLDPALRSVQATYDQVAVDYTDLLRDHLATSWTDQAMLKLFADLVLHPDEGHDGGRVGTVADIGCGPGRITGHLAALGLDVFGIDLSPGMIEVARREHPDLRFEVGTMTALDLPTSSLAGALGWYSLIHLPDHLIPVALAEYRRVIVPGGHLLLAFQEGEQVRHIAAAYGHEISLDLHRRRIADYEPWLRKAGFTIFSSMVVAPGDREKEPQAYLIARAEPKDGPVAA